MKKRNRISTWHHRDLNIKIESAQSSLLLYMAMFLHAQPSGASSSDEETSNIILNINYKDQKSH
jgi:hypothetical protein